MEEDIFKKSIFQLDKLIEYGFQKENNDYVYKKNMSKENFEIILTFSNDKVKAKIIDKELNEEYRNYRITSQIGEFVSSIREELKELLLDVKKKCTISNTYIFPQTNRISQKIKEKYQDNPEFLWDDDKASVFRNQTNKKWYGIIMYVNQNRFSQEDKMVEVMNVKLDPKEIEELIKRNGYYKAYHMNKKYWISIVLDDTLPDEEILEKIEESHQYTERRKQSE